MRLLVDFTLSISDSRNNPYRCGAVTQTVRGPATNGCLKNSCGHAVSICKTRISQTNKSLSRRKRAERISITGDTAFDLQQSQMWARADQYKVIATGLVSLSTPSVTPAVR